MAFALRGVPVILPLTQDLAKNHCELESAHADRPLSEVRLNHHRKAFSMGMFRPVQWARAYCRQTGKWYKTNGKHTSTMFCCMPDVLLKGMLVYMEEYDCETLADVARLYNTYDSNVQTKDQGAVNQSIASIIPELGNIKPSLIRLVVSAIAADKWPAKMGRSVVSTNDKADLLFDHTEDVLWLEKNVGSRKEYPFMWKQAPMAAMLTTKGKDAAAATEFWRRVRCDEGLTDKLPERMLSFLLKTKGLKSDALNVAKGLTRQAKEVYCRCLLAWNAWRSGVTDFKWHYKPQNGVPEVV